MIFRASPRRTRILTPRVQQLVEGFETEREKIRLPDTSRVYFVDPEQEDQAQSAGKSFWLPVTRAYGIFVCAYSALFAIPAFTNEALARQPDRFSFKRLPLTIRSTSSFILDAFGYDRRTERERKVLYSPGPVISSNDKETADKARISNAAMAYFGAQLLLTAERWSDVGSEEKNWHFEYVSSFFRSGGYGFPARDTVAGFIQGVDEDLADAR